MPRFSDVITNKISPSNPIPYEQAVDKFSLDFFKAVVFHDFKYISDLCYGLGFLYHKSMETVQDDLIICADKHAEQTARRIGMSLPDMQKWERQRL